MAMNYSNEGRVYIYFSGETAKFARDQIDKISFNFREIFIIESGPNRFDEPKYRLPLISEMPYIFTMDDKYARLKPLNLSMTVRC